MPCVNYNVCNDICFSAYFERRAYRYVNSLMNNFLLMIFLRRILTSCVSSRVTFCTIWLPSFKSRNWRPLSDNKILVEMISTNGTLNSVSWKYRHIIKVKKKTSYNLRYNSELLPEMPPTNLLSTLAPAPLLLAAPHEWNSLLNAITGLPHIRMKKLPWLSPDLEQNFTDLKIGTL